MDNQNHHRAFGKARYETAAPNYLEDPHEESAGVIYYSFMGLIAVVLGIGAFWLGGDFFNFGFSKSKDTYVSTVAANCDRDWVPRARNDSVLMCYLTTNVSRLCNPKEHDNLVAVYQRYSDDRAAFEADEYARNVKKAVEIRQNQVALQDAVNSQFRNIQAHIDGRATGASPDKISAFFKKLDERSFSSDAERRAAQVKRVPDWDISDAIRRLAMDGYVQESDFGWFHDKIVNDALSDVGTPSQACRAPSTG